MSSLQPRRPPHITVNSGSGGNLLDQPDSSPSTATPGTARQLLPSNRSFSGNSGPYSPGPLRQESAEMLLPPTRQRTPRYQDDPSQIHDAVPRSPSAVSSRRTSWSSDAGSRDSRMGPFRSPFDDSRSPSRAGSDDDNINTQTVSEKYNIMPSAGLLLFPEDVEKDDYLHNPDPNDKDGEKCDIWNRRALVNLGGLIFLTLGCLVLFIGYPIITAIEDVIDPPDGGCSADPDCLSSDMSLLKNQRTGLIDPDTPDDVKTITSHDGKELKLVFSDEFNTDGRTFYDGDDPYFEAVNIWYGVTQDLEWYDPDAISTENGTLNIRFDAFQNHNLNYRSGMLQSWNKLCFKGGRLEASISLPGRGDVEGFWPGFWAMGNLGRPGYPATTDGLWPYSYHDECDLGITANQSDPDGLSWLPGMRLPACTCSGEDHPNAGKSRTAPEIDVIEASVGYMGTAYNNGTGTASQSYQAAPFDIWYQPDAEYMEIYDREISGLNVYRGGVYQQALSTVTWLNDEWYDGNAYQKYAFEYTPGADGDVTWFVGDDATWRIEGAALRPNGNVGQRTIAEEPMSIVANLGMSTSFALVFTANLMELMPAYMRFDYIRIYQDPDNVIMTCDPDDYPTTDYIANHSAAYTNPNLTLWSDTNFTWPKNSFVDDCST